MLLIAVICFITDKKTTIIFPPKKKKKEKRGKKKGYAFSTAMKRRLSRFFGKILPEA
jgi:hypothetical protein